SGSSWPWASAGTTRASSGRSSSASTLFPTTRRRSMSAGSDGLVPGLPLTREQALSLPGMRRYRLVEFLVRWEHFGAARELLESLVGQKAGKFFYQYRLAQCYLATGDVERAKQVARELYASSSTRAVGTLAIGDVFYVEGRLARA